MGLTPFLSRQLRLRDKDTGHAAACLPGPLSSQGPSIGLWLQGPAGTPLRPADLRLPSVFPPQTHRCKATN